jgi:hypothetical protein
MHVAACAFHLIAPNADSMTETVVLTTRNLRDFRKRALAELGIELRSPDEFLLALLAKSPRTFADAFRLFRMDLKSSPDVAPLLGGLRKDGLQQTAEALKAMHEAGGSRL